MKKRSISFKMKLLHFEQAVKTLRSLIKRGFTFEFIANQLEISVTSLKSLYYGHTKSTYNKDFC